MSRAIRSLLVAVVAAALPLPLACSGAPGPAEDVGSSAEAITTGTIISRADEWVQAKLLYCQAPNGASDTIDPACPSVCVRQSNSQWDAYRSDCSGFVSWAWGLPAPGRTTSELAPADTTVSYVIQGSALQPGDALNVPGDHVVLFVGWITPGSEANFYEEPGCSATPNYAHAFTSAVTISGSSVTIAYEGKAFTAIRYTGATLGGDAGAVASGGDASASTPCTVTTTGESGVCLDTAVCAEMSGHVSTPGYCPGANNIQCCTGPAVSSGGDASTPTGSGSGTGTGAGSGTGTGTGSAEGSGTGGSAGTGTGTAGGSQADSGVTGTTTPGSSDAGPRGADGSTFPADPSTFAAPSTGGCSTSPRGGRPAGATWMLGLGALGLALISRRRRGR